MDEHGVVVRRLEAPAGNAIDPAELQAVLFRHDPFRLAAEGAAMKSWRASAPGAAL